MSLRKEVMEEIVSQKNVVTRTNSDEVAKPEGLITANGQVTMLTSDEDNRDDSVRPSQPGPTTGPFLSATAVRAARKKPIRSVNYADSEKNDYLDRPAPRQIIQYKIDDSGTNSPTRDTSSPLPINNALFRVALDNRSLNSNRVYSSTNDLRGLSTPRKRSVATIGDAMSIRSIETQAPPPTNPAVNKQVTRDYMTSILSCIYAIFLVTIGLLIYISDAFLHLDIAPIFTLVLTVIGFLYMIYLIYDINKYKSVMHENEKLKIAHLDRVESFYRKHEGEYEIDDTVMTPPKLTPLSHEYCFSQGRHSGSFYLKLGASGFALGHLVHSVLHITREINFFLEDDDASGECQSITQIMLDIINPIYVFFQLYFIFKYSNVIIMKRQNLARVAFMHFLGSSLCIWISTIVRETVLALALYAQTLAEGYEDSSEERDTYDIFLIDISVLYEEQCAGSSGLNSIFMTVSPYLYPFTVEFNILIVGVFYVVWSNIGNCQGEGADDEDNSSIYESKSNCKLPTASEDNDYTSNIVIYADCHASNRGIFLGMVVIVIIFGVIILGFIFSSVGDAYKEMVYFINDVTTLFLHTTLLITALVAYSQTQKLDINGHSMSLLDDVLLFICLPAFFVETALSMVATISTVDIIRSIDFAIMAVQVVIQTTLIVDGLRRCSNSRKLRRSKPGRELIMFLLIANVGMWLFNTFSYKSAASLDVRYVFYGKIFWSILGHLTLPLIMFYRFHSSVCFADIWSSAYKPGSDH